MLVAFKQFIDKEKLFSEDDTILLAVSGGIDSVVLCELFHQSGYKFAIAHCNFHLRGDESNKDELFVKGLAEHYEVAFFCKHFETKEYAGENGISIQMAARDLRYEWFKELLKAHSYPYVATGHHRDDNIETFFINLLRGTGIRGLRAMLPKQHNSIRPLLFAGRTDIVEFCEKNKLTYREDASNAETKYERNKIRHELLPLFRDLSKNFDISMAQNLERFRETESALNQMVREVRKDLLSQRGSIFFISIPKLKKLENIKFYLFEILYEFGFNESTVEDIIKSLESISGKQFFSPSYRLIRDRESFIITPLAEENQNSKTYLIDRTDNEIENPFPFSMKILDNHQNFIFERNKKIAYLDYNKLKFPLHLRKWQKGDFFYPFGMWGKKKLSDYFSDMKLSVWEKENFYLLCSNEDIIWLVGERIDNRFRVGKDTKQILMLELR